MKTIALIPARGGSQRSPKKNIRLLNGHPLIAYTIQQAKNAELFDDIYVSSDDGETLEIAERYGAGTIERPLEISGSLSEDYLWVKHAISILPPFDVFTILRPTNPFRAVGFILYGYYLLINNHQFDSVRAIRPVREHPHKMWIYHKFIDGSGRVTSLLSASGEYDLPIQRLDKIWIQTGGLQVHRTESVKDGDLSGTGICGVMQHGYGCLDINTVDDFEYAEFLIEKNKAKLVEIK